MKITPADAFDHSEGEQLLLRNSANAMNKPLAAVEAMTIRRVFDDNLMLAAFNNAIQTSGYIPEANMAFQAAVDAKLVKENGRPWDLEALQAASAYEVNRRVAEGEWE